MHHFNNSSSSRVLCLVVRPKLRASANHHKVVDFSALQHLLNQVAADCLAPNHQQMAASSVIHPKPNHQQVVAFSALHLTNHQQIVASSVVHHKLKVLHHKVSASDYLTIIKLI